MIDLDRFSDQVLAEVASAVAGVTTHRGQIPWDDIGPDQYPFAMLHSAEGPVERLQPLNQEQTSVLVQVEVVLRAATQSELYQVLTDVRSQLVANRRLMDGSGDVVDWCWLSGFIVVEGAEVAADREERRGLVLEISAVRVD